MQLVKPITLQINQKIWNLFKAKVPRPTTLNNKIVNLIEEFLKNET